MGVEVFFVDAVTDTGKKCSLRLTVSAGYVDRVEKVTEKQRNDEINDNLAAEGVIDGFY